jgi:hypothetical protein
VLSDGGAHDVKADDALAGVFENLYLDEIVRGRLADYVGERVKSRTKGATVRRDLATLPCGASAPALSQGTSSRPTRFGNSASGTSESHHHGRPIRLPSWLAA